MGNTNTIFLQKSLGNCCLKSNHYVGESPIKPHLESRELEACEECERFQQVQRMGEGWNKKLEGDVGTEDPRGDRYGVQCGSDQQHA